MKNRWKHIFIPVLAMALCLSLAACGNSDDVAGEDWRTTGVVVGSGTITHDSESVDVLVTVCESSAAFYRDLPEQVLFDSVSFPMNIPDAEQSFNAISFDDMDGDGESDVLVSFIHENGDATELVWIWDPVERYVFREDLSTVTLSGGDLSEYVGLWEYQGENLWLRIHEDATWEFVNDQDDVIEYGTLWVDENGVTLHFDGSGDVLPLLLNALYALSALKKPPQLVKPAFQFRLMALAGYEPMADGCALCGAPQPENPMLDVVHGVVHCGKCREKGGLSLPLTASGLAALRYVLYGDPRRLYSFSLPPEGLRALNHAADAYVSAQLERSFRTLDYYKTILPQEETKYE